MAKVKDPTTHRDEQANRIMHTATMESSGAKLILPRVNTEAETARERVFREAKARQTAELFLGLLFGWLKANVGVEDAWRNFNGWTERARPKGLVGHRGPSDHRNDSYLLGVYDQLAEQASGKTEALPRVIAEKLHRDKQGVYGNSVEAIAKKVRRLVSERQANRAIDAEVRADLQRLMRKLEWDLPKGSTKERRRNPSTKSLDK